MKISEWLSEHVESHAIQDHDKLAKTFTESTGEVPSWPTHSTKDTREAIEGRGLGGYVVGNDETRMTWGYEVARSLAAKYAPGYVCTKMGRGYIFREALEALQNVGK